MPQIDSNGPVGPALSPVSTTRGMICGNCHTIYPPDEGSFCARDGGQLTSSDRIFAGKYVLEERLGFGQMGDVYRATQSGVGRKVALKVLRADQADNTEMVKRFEREAQIASSIDHPNAVTIYESGRSAEGQAYIAMEYLIGETLGRLMERECPLGLPRALDLLLPVVRAVAAAHSRSIVHRDLKPDNIFIASTANGKVVPKLLDFGVSKLTTPGVSSNTAVSSVLGTPHYMAPEQALGMAAVDARADQYTFALVVYECVTGVLPFVSENIMALLHEVSRGVQRPPSLHAPDLPRPLDDILLRALSANPHDRYPDLGALTAELLPFASTRATEVYRALVERDPGDLLVRRERAPSEMTGDFERQSEKRPRRIDEAAATVLLPSQSSSPGIAVPALGTGESSGSVSEYATTEPPAADAGRGRWIGIGVIGVAALALVGWMQLAAPRPTPPPVVETPVPPVAVVAVETPLPVNPEPLAPTADTPVAPTRIVVVAFPSDATLTLDGVLAGQGSLDHQLVLDGAPHTLVVQAPGHAPETVTFTTAAPPARVELARTRRPASSMAVSESEPVSPPVMRPPVDDDVRDTR